MLPRALVAAPAVCASVASSADLRFTNVTQQAGVAVTHAIPANGTSARHAIAGGAVADFNNDGWQDIYFLGGGPEHDRLFLNNHDGTFTDHAAAWGIHAMGAHMGSGAIPADFNADGLIDLYITSHGPPTATFGQPGRHRLLINLGPDTDGQFRFQDFATHCRVHRTSNAIADGYGAAAGDFDLDGDLDLAVAGWVPLGHNVLFRNDGTDGFQLPVFTNVTAAIASPYFAPTGLDNHGFSPRFLDTDGDFYPEIHWVSDYLTSVYLRNNTDGTFTDITAAAGMGLDDNGMGVTQGDFDNDGLIDWYVSSIFDPGKPESGNKLYMNDGDGTFTERARFVGANRGAWGWGVSAVDLDHDGDLDIAEANGWAFAAPFHNIPAMLFINHGDATFTESAAAHGFDHVSDARGLARIDYDNDGDQDIAIFSHREPFALLRNDLISPGNQPADANWLRVFIDTDARADLAPHGAGAVITVETPLKSQVRVIDIGPTYLVNDEISAHFGLGAINTIPRLEIRFHDGTTMTWRNLPANQTLVAQVPACRIDSAAPFGLLDLADIQAFVVAFQKQDALADIAAPEGILDLADLTTFVQLFLSGCP